MITINAQPLSIAIKDNTFNKYISLLLNCASMCHLKAAHMGTHTSVWDLLPGAAKRFTSVLLSSTLFAEYVWYASPVLGPGGDQTLPLGAYNPEEDKTPGGNTTRQNAGTHPHPRRRMRDRRDGRSSCILWVGKWTLRRCEGHTQDPLGKSVAKLGLNPYLLHMCSQSRVSTQTLCLS